MEIVPAKIMEVFEEQWVTLNKRLMFNFRRLYPNESRLNRDDLIQDVFLAFCEGRRHWDPEKVELAKCLCDAMRSIGSHILARENQHRLEPVDELSELTLSQKEDPHTYSQLCDMLRNSVAGDPLLERIVGFYIQDPNFKPGDLMALLPDISHKDAANAYRRLRRSISKLRKVHPND